MKISFNIQNRIWKHVNPIIDIEDCWIWNGGKDKNKYGKIKIFGKTYRVHRVLYQLYKNIIILPTQFVCHRCDNPSCINPNHMFIGTAQDNANDMIKKGRSLFGEKSSNSKIKEEDIINIFNDFINNSLTPTNISKKYNVSETCIRHILQRKSWKYIKLPFTFSIDDYYIIAKKNNLNIKKEKREYFRKRIKKDPNILNDMFDMLKTAPKSDVANYFNINLRTLTRLIKEKV